MPTKSVTCWKNTSKHRIRAPMSSQFERHIQNSNPEPLSNLNQAFQKARGRRPSLNRKHRGCHNVPSRLEWSSRPARTSPIMHVTGSGPGGTSGHRGIGPLGARHQPERLGRCSNRLGRRGRRGRGRGDPAARGGDQEPGRLPAEPDREGEGRGLFAWAGPHGAASDEGSRADASIGQVSARKIVIVPPSGCMRGTQTTRRKEDRGGRRANA